MTHAGIKQSWMLAWARGLGACGGRYWRRISQSHIGQLVGAGAIAQGIAFAISPLLTRIYTPADFGVLAQYAAVSAVLQAVAALRYDLTIPLAKDETLAVRSLALALVLSVASSIVVAAFLALGGAAQLSESRWAAASPVVWMLPLSVLGGGAYQSLAYFAARRSAFSEIARSKLVQSVGAGATQLSMGLAGLGAIGLALGQVMNSALGLFRLTTRLEVVSEMKRANVSFPKLYEIAKDKLGFAMTYSASAVINQVGLGVHLILVGGMYGFAAAGQLMLASRLMGSVDLITGPIGQVYYARACEAHRADYAAFRRLFFRTSWQLLALGGTIAATMWILGPWIVTIVFGSAWGQAGLFLRYLSFFAFANVVCSPISMTLAVLEQPQIQLGWDVTRLALVSGAFVLAHHYHMSAVSAVLLFSVSAGAALVLLYFVNLTVVIRGEGVT